MASRQRGLVVAARSYSDGPGREPEPFRIHRQGPGFRRRPLDDPGRARCGGAGRCAVGGAVHALPLAPGPYLCRKASERHAPEVWRTHRVKKINIQPDTRASSTSETSQPMPLEKELNLTSPSDLTTVVRQTGPCIMVIFGASGDLTARKLMPALYNLAKSGMLSQEFAIVGVARNDMTTEQFRQTMSDNLQSFATEKADSALRDWLIGRIYYVAGEFKDPALYTRLAATLTEADQAHKTRGNHFYYMATSPAFFGEIVDQLGAAGLACGSNGQWRRMVFEKPFCTDLESAKELNRRIRKVLSEDQIFRIDHYLGKETVQNILVFRFSNGIFEPLWSHRL